MSKTNFYDYGVSFHDWAGVRTCSNCTMVLSKSSFTGLHTVCNKCRQTEQEKAEQLSNKLENRKWIRCPICKVDDTRADREDEGWVVHCTNLVCRSNVFEKGRYHYDKKLEETEYEVGKYKALEKTVEQAKKSWQDTTEKLVKDVITLQQEVEYWKEQALKRYDRSVLLNHRLRSLSQKYVDVMTILRKALFLQ